MAGVILGVGELLFDHLPGGRVPGGAPANFAYHCRRLGRAAGVVSRVGRDEPGVALLAWLRRCGLDAGVVQIDPDHATGAVDVTVADGVPSYAIRPNAAWDFLNWDDDLHALCASAAAVATGTLARRAGSREVIEIAEQSCRGVRYFDVNLREPIVDESALVQALGASTVAKLTAEELVTINQTPAELTHLYAELSAVVVTRGADGAEWHGKSGLIAEVPGLAVDVVDTVGAGDAFGAAVVVGLLAGREPAAILRAANEYAARVCTHAGAIPPGA